MDSLNESFDSLYTSKIKKRFQFECEKKQKELENYKQQKRYFNLILCLKILIYYVFYSKIIDDLKDNFNKMRLSS